MTVEDIIEILTVIQGVLESDPSTLPPIVKKRFNAFINLAKAALQITNG